MNATDLQTNSHGTYSVLSPGSNGNAAFYRKKDDNVPPMHQHFVSLLGKTNNAGTKRQASLVAKLPIYVDGVGRSAVTMRLQVTIDQDLKPSVVEPLVEEALDIIAESNVQDFLKAGVTPT